MTAWITHALIIIAAAIFWPILQAFVIVAFIRVGLRIQSVEKVGSDDGI